MEGPDKNPFGVSAWIFLRNTGNDVAGRDLGRSADKPIVVPNKIMRLRGGWVMWGDWCSALFSPTATYAGLHQHRRATLTLFCSAIQATTRSSRFSAVGGVGHKSVEKWKQNPCPSDFDGDISCSLLFLVDALRSPTSHVRRRLSPPPLRRWLFEVVGGE